MRWSRSLERIRAGRCTRISKLEMVISVPRLGEGRSSWWISRYFGPRNRMEEDDDTVLVDADAEACTVMGADVTQ